MQKIKSGLKISLRSGVCCILVVFISFLIRNSQQVEEVTIEAPALTLQDILDEVKLSKEEDRNTSNKTDCSQGKEQESDCGPLEVRASEEDGCFTLNGTSISCPTYAEHDTIIVKRCIPPYGNGRTRKPFVGYKCTEYGWAPSYNSCYPDCGLSTKNNKHPWGVAIYITGTLLCTGTIITPFHVLSAIRCFGSVRFDNKSIDDLQLYTIVAGKHYSDIHRKHKSAEVRKIKRTITHLLHIDEFKGWSSDIVNLVLIEVDKEFMFFGDIQPACLDWENFYDESDFRDGNEAVAVGWQFDKDITELVPCENQNEFNVQYWQERTCKEDLSEISGLWKTFSSYKFCGSTAGNRSSCGVAEGVGLFFKSSPWRYYLKGITSNSIAIGNVTYLFYLKVAVFHDWLKEHIRDHAGFVQYFAKTIDHQRAITGCRLPEHIKYGRFSLTLGTAYKINTWVASSSNITLSCAGSEDEPVIIRCSLGVWIPSINELECKRPERCPALPSSESEYVTCSLNGREVSCTDAIDNTTAIVQCKPFYTLSGNKHTYKCQNGEWDQPFSRCVVECGSEWIKREYPWVVAIYRFRELICSGTIISKKYVLSAAHCFADLKTGAPRSKESYTIIGGKYYRNISVVEQSSQSRKIRSMYIHNDYKGSLVKHRDDIALIELDMEFTPTWDVQPVCIDWENEYEDFDFVDGNIGVVTGWGITANGTPSIELQKLLVPFRPEDVCVKNLPEDFSYKYVATDKICAGYAKSGMNVCDGDDGGGLYFKSLDNRLYIRGIVSLIVKNDVAGCISNTFALFTKVSRYLSWMESITGRIL